jgi:type II secretory pathway pseudopilin PulG
LDFMPIRSRSAFTLIETLVVATIVIVVALAGFLGLAQYRNKQALESGLSEIRAAVEGTKRRSVVQEDGNRWGIRLTNATSGISSYAVFKGASYATSGVQRTYSFRGSLGFGNPSTSSTYDLLFAPLSGALSENKVVTLVGSSEGLIGDLILRTVGSVTARRDHDVVGYWHFDEGTATTTYDASGNANTGTLTNSPTWQSGTSCKAGGCLLFSETGKYVSFPYQSSLKLGDTGTLSLWFYPNSLAASTHNLISYGGSNYSAGYLMSQFGSNLYVYWMSGSPLATLSSFFSVGSWSHIAVVNDSGSLSVYKNGTLAGTATSSGSIANSYATYIGGDPNNATWTPSGIIDEIRVYDRALSASEIEAIYNDLQ